MRVIAWLRRSATAGLSLVFLLSLGASADERLRASPQRSVEQSVPAGLAEAAVVRFVTHDFPPFTTLHQGLPGGPIKELIDLICQRIQARCEHRVFPWERAQRRVRSGDADAMYVIGRNKERQLWLRFSDLVLTTEYGFFVREDNRMLYRNEDDLAGLDIGVYGPSNTSHTLQRLRSDPEQYGIEIFPDNEVAFRMLAARRNDAVFSNKDVGEALIRRLGLSGLRYSGTLKTLGYHLGFSRQTLNPVWVERFNQELQRIRQEGVLHSTLLKYGLSASPE